MTALKLTLADKGLLLIAIPLSLQCLCFAGFGMLLTQTEALFQREFREKNVYAQVNWLGTLVCFTALAYQNYLVTGDQQCRSSYNRYSALIKPQLEALNQLFKDDPEQSALVSQSSATIGHLLSASNQNVQKKDNKDYINVSDHLSDTSLRKSWIDLSELRHRILKSEQVKWDAEAISLPQTRATLRGAFITIVVFDTLLLFSAVFFYVNRIALRLKRIEDNLQRLKDGVPLPAPLDGNDEIATLDGAFHAAADSLLSTIKERERLDRTRAEFVSMVSHDLRTPLAAVQGTLEMLSEGSYGGLTDRGAARVASAKDSLGQLLNLVNELLQLDKLRAGMVALRLEPCSLQEIANQAIETVSPFADKLQVQLCGPQSDVDVLCDLDRVRQVLVNLLSNAVKFSAAGKRVVIQIEHTDSEAIVKVVDEGIGIAEEEKDAVFERYQKAGNPTGSDGFGLGLAICKAIVEAHNGKISVESHKNEGSTFQFTLPCTISTLATVSNGRVADADRA